MVRWCENPFSHLCRGESFRHFSLRDGNPAFYGAEMGISDLDLQSEICNLKSDGPLRQLLPAAHAQIAINSYHVEAAEPILLDASAP